MKYKKAVVIGRFQPFHNGHIKMIESAMTVAEKVVVIIGSASEYPNVKNPFKTTDRVVMIKEWLYENHPDKTEYKNFSIHMVDDSHYNEQRWKTEIRRIVDSDSVCIVGADKDKQSYWLKEFGWDVHLVDIAKDANGNVISASNFRHDYLRNQLHLYNPAVLEVLPKTTFDRLERFAQTKTYERLHEEQLKWDIELEKFANYPYPDSLNCCTADSVVICNNHLLVVTRKFAPGKGAYALPGGHKNSDETFFDCAVRELREEVKMKVAEKVIRGSVVNKYLFDYPFRSVYFSKPTMAYYFQIEPEHDGSLPRVRGADDALCAEWLPLHKVKEFRSMFFDDHYQIVLAFTGL